MVSLESIDRYAKKTKGKAFHLLMNDLQVSVLSDVEIIRCQVVHLAEKIFSTWFGTILLMALFVIHIMEATKTSLVGI